MARPVKWRKIESVPKVDYFVPYGPKARPEEKNILKVEELEAIRLKDCLGLEQEECAVHMEVSRPTFQKILTAARIKIADSLICGKAIRIEGGNFTRNICPVHCRSCGNSWLDRVESLEEEADAVCPSCGSGDIACAGKCGGMRHNCRRRGALLTETSQSKHNAI